MIRLVSLLLSLMLWHPSHAAEPGHITKAVPLRAAPSVQAVAVRTLEQDTQVGVLKTERWWVQVRAGETEGWVPVFYVRGGGLPEKPGAASEAAGVVGLVTGRQGSGKVTSVIGVRGLNEEDLKGASFAPDELQRLESFAVSRGEAERFARELPLDPQTVEYLEAPVSSSEVPAMGGEP